MCTSSSAVNKWISGILICLNEIIMVTNDIQFSNDLSRVMAYQGDYLSMVLL